MSSFNLAGLREDSLSAVEGNMRMVGEGCQ